MLVVTLLHGVPDQLLLESAETNSNTSAWLCGLVACIGVGEPTAGRQRNAQGGGCAQRHHFCGYSNSTCTLAQGRHILLHEHRQNAAPMGGNACLLISLRFSLLGYSVRV